MLFESPAAASISAVAEAHSPLVLKKLASRGIDQQALQPKLTAWLLSLADAQPIAVLIDDLHALDDASLSLVASLALAAARRRLIVVATLREGARPCATDAFAALQRACARFELHPLGRHEVEVLVCSLFGDVPNLALLCDRLYQAAAGNIRETLDIAQMLIARRVLRYEGGQWLLPEALAQDALPSSATELCRARLAELSPLARELAEVHALASHPTLSRQDYARVADGVAAADVDEAISELVAGGLLVGDSQGYGLATPEWIAALEAGLSTPARLERHARLGDLYEGCEQRVIEEVRLPVWWARSPRDRPARAAAHERDVERRHPRADQHERTEGSRGARPRARGGTGARPYAARDPRDPAGRVRDLRRHRRGALLPRRRRVARAAQARLRPHGL